jgi:hypothetical protein
MPGSRFRPPFRPFRSLHHTPWTPSCSNRGCLRPTIRPDSTAPTPGSFRLQHRGPNTRRIASLTLHRACSTMGVVGGLVPRLRYTLYCSAGLPTAFNARTQCPGHLPGYCIEDNTKSARCHSPPLFWNAYVRSRFPTQTVFGFWVCAHTSTPSRR